MRTLFLFVALLFVAGCAMKPQPKKESWVVLIKSPKIKFHDIGYIIKDGEDVTLQLYSAGTAVESFEINHFICTRDGCMRKSSFNAEYLNSAYDDDLLKDLLMRRPIFDGKNLQKLQDGFEQKIKSKEYDILYKVTVDTLYFKDKKNHILFKLKRQ